MVEKYLKERKNLRLVIMILDVRRDPSEGDISIIEWFRYYHIDILFVLTKIDKISRNKIKICQRRMKELLGLPDDSDIIPFSARTGEGKGAVWKEITRLTGVHP